MGAGLMPPGVGTLSITRYVWPLAAGLHHTRTGMSATGVRLPLVEPDNVEARVAALETQVRELAERIRASGTPLPHVCSPAPPTAA